LGGFAMSQTDQIDEDEVLRRMLNPPPESPKPLEERRRDKDKERYRRR
jgi:hypothetical protein